jgi:hypothetical protein
MSCVELGSASVAKTHPYSSIPKRNARATAEAHAELSTSLRVDKNTKITIHQTMDRLAMRASIMKPFIPSCLVLKGVLPRRPISPSILCRHNHSAAIPTQSTQPGTNIAPQSNIHPSAVGHPALSNKRQRRSSDSAFLLTFLGLLAAIGPLSYWYLGYREEHMRKKKEGMLREIQERHQARG